VSGEGTEVTQAARDTRRNAGRPHVICHMMALVDGRIVTDGWPLSPEGRRQCEAVHALYEPDGWLCGRVTMERHFAAGVRGEAELAREHDVAPREDFVVPGEHDSFAFAVEHDDVAPRQLALEGVERRADDVLWLRYRVVGASSGRRRGVVAEPRERPRGVLADERLGVVEGLVQHGHILHRADVAQRDGGVALQPPQLGALHR